MDISDRNRFVVVLTKQIVETRKLSRAAVETLAIVAYHQPVTRAEIEEIRGVVAAAGTLDVLLKTGWIRPRGRRKAPGRPITYGTTEAFLSHFGLEEVGDLPGLEELKGAGMLEGNLPPGFAVPLPSDDSTLREDEDPLEPGDLDLGSGATAADPKSDAPRIKVNSAISRDCAALCPGAKSLFLPRARPSFSSNHGGTSRKKPVAAEDLQMGSLSIWHWIIVLLVVMVLFGGRGKISSLMGDFAQGIKAFKKGMSEDEKTADTKSEPVKTIEAGGSATKTEAERRAEGVRS